MRSYCITLRHLAAVFCLLGATVAKANWLAQCNSGMGLDPVGFFVQTLPGPKIEIGGGQSPLCPGCIQVDRYRSPKEAQIASLRQKLGREPSQGEVRAQLAKLTGHFDVEAPYAVATSQAGIISDVKSLPLRDASVSMIISQNFPWFDQESLKDIPDILKEYDRVLSKGGRIFLLTGQSNGRQKFMNHFHQVTQMNFQILFVNGPYYSGYLLIKP